MLYAKLSELPLEIEGYTLEPRRLATSSGWVRHTTVVRLSGRGFEGAGEDVIYEAANQIELQEAGAYLQLSGRYTFDEYSRLLGRTDLFPDQPIAPTAPLFRRWAFESAALDLALAQAGTSMAAVLGRSPKPTRYVVSLGLGDPASLAPIEGILRSYPRTRFKVDLAECWDEAFVRRLAETRAVDVVDLKGHYRGDFRGPAADADQYRWVAEHLSEAWLEDPCLEGDAAAALHESRERITWDAVLHSAEDLLRLPFKPTCVNIKPSRFGSVAELMAVYEHCERHGIRMYGGGQFELGPGRGQIQCLASLFHPDEPNDVAPCGFNARELPDGLADCPLSPDSFVGDGFRAS